MPIIVEEYYDTPEEAEAKYWGKELLVYNIKPGRYFFSGGMVYAVADYGHIVDIIDTFRKSHPEVGNKFRTLYYTE